VKIPAKNSFAEGAMLEPVNTVLKAVKRLNLLPGDTVLVAGQGPIGLIFTRLLKLAGMNVLATDLLASRLKLAKKFGARWVCRASQLSTFNSQLQFDAAIIAVPSDAAVQQAMQLVRGGGQVLLFAHTKRSGTEGGSQRSEVRGQTSAFRPPSSDLRPPPSGFPLDPASICLDEKDLIGSYSSDFTLQREVVRLVFSRQLDVRKLITHQFGLAEVAAAVSLAARPTETSLKILVAVDGFNQAT
jgi:L-iditol 2-dehydrogenase